MISELDRENDPEVVDSKELLMEFPTISATDWHQAARDYLTEARHIAFVLDRRQSPLEALLDEADSELASGHASKAESVLRSAWLNQIDPSDPIGLHSGVRAGFIAKEIPGIDPDASIVPIVSQSLRHAGLNDVANVIEHFEEITINIGGEAANLLRLGALARVEQWAMTSVEFEEPERT